MVPAGASNPPPQCYPPQQPPPWGWPSHLRSVKISYAILTAWHMLASCHHVPCANVYYRTFATGFPVWSCDSSLSWDFLGIFWQFQASSVALFCFSFFEPLQPGCDPLSVSSFVSLPCRLLHCYGRLGFDLSLRIYPWQSSWTSMEFFESRQSESSPFCRCRGREGQGKNMKKW